MMLSPDDTLDVGRDVFAAGTFGKTIDKAAVFAGLDDDMRAVLAAAAALSERHGCGYGSQDGDVGRLTASLGTWLAGLRAKARAAA